MEINQILEEIEEHLFKARTEMYEALALLKKLKKGGKNG